MSNIGNANDVTSSIVAELVNRSYNNVSKDSLEIAQHCILDWLGVTVAAWDEPLVQILRADALEQGGNSQATMVGSSKAPLYAAALVNGAAGHALDYDDVSFRMTAHASAAMLPALIALSEHLRSSGKDILVAFVAGYEAASRVGMLLAPDHYERGFHGTATIGTFAAAAACTHLLGLDERRTAHAFGIAATQAAGIRSMFGTMCKPFHAGKAALNGLRAARLAERGFESRIDAVERPLGFACTHSSDFDLAGGLGPAPRGYFLYDNLFKFHAACYLTHSSIESIKKLGFGDTVDVRLLQKLVIVLNPTVNGVCTIPDPASGLEVKFSVRQCAALALSGYDTSRLDCFTDKIAADERLAHVRSKIEIIYDEDCLRTEARVTAILEDGRKLEATHDSDVPAEDLQRQRTLLSKKFMGLVAPRVGDARAQMAMEILDKVESQDTIIPLIEACFQKA